MPGNFTSSTKQPFPVRRAGSSSRGNARAELLCAHGSGSLLHAQKPRRVERRRDDAGIAGAAAKIAGQHVAHLPSVGSGLSRNNSVSVDQHSRRAEAALQTVMIAEGLLQDD